MVQPDILKFLKQEIAAMTATIERLEEANMEVKEGSSTAVAVMKAETIADLKTAKVDLESLLAQLQMAYQTLQD